jgi:sterol desaturase/sphingolipid hydroxylase (fatty acid hydroxylase superfamily)
MIATDIFLRAVEAWYGFMRPDLLAFLGACVVFTVLGFLPVAKRTPQPLWWRNSAVRTDLCYLLLNPAIRYALRLAPLIIILLIFLIFAPLEHVYAYFTNGFGPLGKLGPAAQFACGLIIADFLAYWSHRLFHGGLLWPAHAVHHGPRDVDWTTAYRFHPINFVLGPWLVMTGLLLLGVSPTNIGLLAPVDLAMAFFVHANLDVTLGPLRYLIATPVFHRWHHSVERPGHRVNYGANFAIWDVIFRTYHLPPGGTPIVCGLPGETIEENYVVQLLYPFRKWLGGLRRIILRRRSRQVRS